MFSKKYDISIDEIKSCLITALKATIAYFGLTIAMLYQNIMALNWTYLLSIAVFFVLVFAIKFVEKFLNDGDKKNLEIYHEILGQSTEDIKPEDQQK